MDEGIKLEKERMKIDKTVKFSALILLAGIIVLLVLCFIEIKKDPFSSKTCGEIIQKSIERKCYLQQIGEPINLSQINNLSGFNQNLDKINIKLI